MGVYVVNIDEKYNTSTTLTLNVARLKEYHICVALRSGHIGETRMEKFQSDGFWCHFDYESSDTCNFRPKSESD